MGFTAELDEELEEDPDFKDGSEGLDDGNREQAIDEKIPEQPQIDLEKHASNNYAAVVVQHGVSREKGPLCINCKCPYASVPHN